MDFASYWSIDPVDEVVTKETGVDYRSAETFSDLILQYLNEGAPISKIHYVEVEIEDGDNIPVTGKSFIDETGTHRMSCSVCFRFYPMNTGHLPSTCERFAAEELFIKIHDH